jgi:hypothetical protein
MEKRLGKCPHCKAPLRAEPVAGAVRDALEWLQRRINNRWLTISADALCCDRCGFARMEFTRGDGAPDTTPGAKVFAPLDQEKGE